VDAALAARLVLEVLDGIGDVDEVAVDPGFREDGVEELSCRADEGLAGDVLLVAGLLADEDDARLLRAFAEDGLGGLAPEVAAAAGFGGARQLLQRARAGAVGRARLPRRAGPASGAPGSRRGAGRVGSAVSRPWLSPSPRRRGSCRE
jgi:hypothetical protein